MTLRAPVLSERAQRRADFLRAKGGMRWLPLQPVFFPEALKGKLHFTESELPSPPHALFLSVVAASSAELESRCLRAAGCREGPRHLCQALEPHALHQAEFQTSLWLLL